MLPKMIVKILYNNFAKISIVFYKNVMQYIFGNGCEVCDAGACRINAEHGVQHLIMRLSTVYMRLVYTKAHDVFLLL